MYEHNPGLVKGSRCQVEIQVQNMCPDFINDLVITAIQRSYVHEETGVGEITILVF